jgi:predicted DNA-binding transcriptional regulator YafY
LAAIVLDALAEDGAQAGSADHDLPKNRSPEEAEAILVALHAYAGRLIETKRAERAERAISKAAADLGVSVEALKALQAAQKSA